MSREVLRIVAASSFVAMAITNSVLAFVTFRRLRRNHPARWRELGEPLLFWNMSARNRFLTTKFLWTSSYRDLNDSQLSRLMDIQKIVLVLCVVSFVVFLVTAVK